MKLTLIGAGIKHLENLTLLAISKINQSKVLLILGNPTDIKQLIKVKNIVCINDLYINDEIDSINYDKILSNVFSYVTKYENVSFLVPGHPRFAVSLASMLETECINKNIKFEVIEGISSFDTMINDLKIDPIESGSILLDANRLILYELPLIKEVNTFLYHISSVANKKTNYLNPSESNHLSELQEYLLKFYSPNKTVYLIKSSNAINKKGFAEKVKLKSLLKYAEQIDFATSLYIPSENPKKLNSHFLSKLK